MSKKVSHCAVVVISGVFDCICMCAVYMSVDFPLTFFLKPENRSSPISLMALTAPAPQRHLDVAADFFAH